MLWVCQRNFHSVGSLHGEKRTLVQNSDHCDNVPQCYELAKGTYSYNAGTSGGINDSNLGCIQAVPHTALC